MVRAHSIPLAVMAAALLFCAYFGIRSQFAPDDMMNMSNHLKRGPLQTVLDTVLFWNGAYRPLGGAWYLTHYGLFGLQPLPYRVTGLLIHAASCVMTYTLCLRFGFSRFASLIAALVVIGHPNMCDVYFNNSAIYDVLAFFFSLAALLVWTVPDRWAPLLAVMLFVLALASKEIAATVPLLFAAYDLLWRKHSPARFTAIVTALLIVCCYAYGKIRGSQALAAIGNYQIELSWQRYVTNNLGHWNEFLYTTALDRGFYLLLIAAATVAMVLLARSRTAVMAVICVWVLPLPISFIPGRGGSSLLLPLLGAGMIAAVAVQWIRRHEVMVVLVIALCALNVWEWKDRPPMFYNNYAKTWSVIRQLTDIRPYPPPGANVLFINDPFSDWDMAFIAQLVWHDPDASVWLSRKLTQPLSPSEVASLQQVFEFHGNRLTRIQCRDCAK